MGQRADAARSIEDVVRSMMSALRAMRAVSRARRFPLAVPRGTPAEARAARLALKENARRVDETARRVGWKINDYRRKQTNSRTIEDAPRESDERAARALEVKATLSQAPSGGAQTRGVERERDNVGVEKSASR